MASKGSFNTTGYNDAEGGNTYLTFAWSIKSQDPATNKTVINWTLKGAGIKTGYYVKAGGFKVIIDGKTVYSKSTDYRIELYNGTVVASGTATITHDTDGTKEFSASAEAGIYYYAVNCKGSDSWELTPIPRYATVTQSVSEKTETSVKMNWASDSTVDYIWYSIDNGSNWTGIDVVDGKGGTYTINDLTVNTTYKIKTRVRRKDNQLTTDSTALSVTTYNYPYCIEAPAFVIGEPISLGFENPLGREFTFYIIANGTEIANNWTISGTSYYGLDEESTQNQLYATIPNSQNATYSVVTICDGYRISYSNPKSSIFSVDPIKSAPTGFEFYYTDTNEKTKDLTGDETAIIKGYSNLLVGIFAGDGAEAQNSANMDRYVFTVDTLSDTRPYLEDNVATILGVINSAGVKRLSVRAYDSRELHSLEYKDITVYEYEKPVIYADIKRLNNFETQTTLKISGKYERLTINETDKNAIKKVQYRYREINGETYGSWSEFEPVDNVTSIEGEFVCGDVYLSLDSGKAFEVEIEVTDGLDSATSTVNVDVGKAIFFISSNKKTCYINDAEVMTFNTAYPVGSVFCSATNTDPSETYGGTWELIDKGFKSSTTEIAQSATDYLSSFKVTSVRKGDSIRIRINFVLSKEITDAHISIGTVDLSQHGLTNDGSGYFPYHIYCNTLITDGGNGIALLHFLSTGELQTTDCFTSDGVHALPAGTQFYYDVVLIATPSQMLDSFCDKFYWKKTA